MTGYPPLLSVGAGGGAVVTDIQTATLLRIHHRSEHLTPERLGIPMYQPLMQVHLPQVIVSVVHTVYWLDLDNIRWKIDRSWSAYCGCDRLQTRIRY